MGLLLGDGESLRGNVSNDPRLLAVGSVGKHREPVRASDTSLLHDCYVGIFQHFAATVGSLEIFNGRHISQCVSSMEGAYAEFRRSVAPRARSVESLSEGDPRGNREVRRRVRRVPVRHEEGQGNAVPSSFPRGLSTAMSEDQRQLSYVQARA